MLPLSLLLTLLLVSATTLSQASPSHQTTTTDSPREKKLVPTLHHSIKVGDSVKDFDKYYGPATKYFPGTDFLYYYANPSSSSSSNKEEPQLWYVNISSPEGRYIHFDGFFGLFFTPGPHGEFAAFNGNISGFALSKSTQEAYKKFSFETPEDAIKTQWVASLDRDAKAQLYQYEQDQKGFGWQRHKAILDMETGKNQTKDIPQWITECDFGEDNDGNGVDSNPHRRYLEPGQCMRTGGILNGPFNASLFNYYDQQNIVTFVDVDMNFRLTRGFLGCDKHKNCFWSEPGVETMVYSLDTGKIVGKRLVTPGASLPKLQPGRFADRLTVLASNKLHVYDLMSGSLLHERQLVNWCSRGHRNENPLKWGSYFIDYPSVCAESTGYAPDAKKKFYIYDYNTTDLLHEVDLEAWPKGQIELLGEESGLFIAPPTEKEFPKSYAIRSIEDKGKVVAEFKNCWGLVMMKDKNMFAVLFPNSEPRIDIFKYY